MKKTFRRVLSLTLSLIMAVAVFAPSFSVAAANDLPIIYVIGKNSPIYNKDGKKIHPAGGIDTLIENNKDMLTRAFTLSITAPGGADWSIYSDAIYTMVCEYFKDFPLDNNGEISNGSYVKKNAKPKKKTSGFTLTDYYFYYDSRLDPFTNAKNLNTYINKVLSATGKKKVQLVGRCLGGTVVSAYLSKYGCDKVDTVLYYAAASQGVIPISCFFAGDIAFDSDALKRYATTDMDEEFSDLTKLMIKLASLTSTFNLGTQTVTSIYKNVAKTLYPRIVLATYGTCPGYWSMVRDDYYEDAKKVVFGSATKKYANLITKIDNYHNKVFKKLPTILKNCQKKGMKIAIISKYNKAMPPLFTNCLKQADNLVELESASMGATCANMEKTLTSAYITYLENAGKDKYLSADLIVDASSCAFPNYTWFVKNLGHETFPSAVNKLIMQIFGSTKQYTVNSNSKYPQFMDYDETTKKLSAVTKPDTTKDDPNKDTGFAAKLLAFFSTFMQIIRALLGIK